MTFSQSSGRWWGHVGREREGLQPLPQITRPGHDLRHPSYAVASCWSIIAHARIQLKPCTNSCNLRIHIAITFRNTEIWNLLLIQHIFLHYMPSTKYMWSPHTMRDKKLCNCNVVMILKIPKVCICSPRGIIFARQIMVALGPEMPEETGNMFRRFSPRG